MTALCAVFLFSACDECRKIECENNGVCEEGICDCPEWYEGELCESGILEKYEGLYEVSQICNDWYEADETILNLNYRGERQMSFSGLEFEFENETDFVVSNQYDLGNNLVNGYGTCSESSFEFFFTVTYTYGETETCEIEGFRVD